MEIYILVGRNRKNEGLNIIDVFNTKEKAEYFKNTYNYGYEEVLIIERTLK